MALPIRIETRTGDTPASKRQRQRRDPPDILLTTPEQLALLLASADAPLSVRLAQARDPRRAAFAGDVEARRSAVARPRAAVHDRARSSRPSASRRPSPSRTTCAAISCRSTGGDAARRSRARRARRRARHHHARHAPSGCPGPATRRAMRSAKSTTLIKRHKMTLVFVNTRSQAESIFQQLWGMNDDNLRDRAASRLARCRAAPPVEDAMAAGRLRAVVAHLVARSRHRLGRCRSRRSMSARRRAPRACCSASAAPTTAWTSRRTACWCRPIASRCSNAAPRIDAVAANAQDTPPLRTGALDVLAQHVLGCACARAVRRR